MKAQLGDVQNVSNIETVSNEEMTVNFLKVKRKPQYIAMYLLDVTTLCRYTLQLILCNQPVPQNKLSISRFLDSISTKMTMDHLNKFRLSTGSNASHIKLCNY